jgi:LuxR family maltose regulon positive regulatory protein
VAAATRSDSAAELLDGAVPRSPRHDVVLAMLRASTAVDRDTAARWTETAVHVAREHSMLQTLVSQRQLDLVERIAWQLPDGWMDRLRRASAATRLDSAANAALVEPLTVRERDVLRFLPSRLTLKEIADELYVSVNTLKFHLKVIYRKLGVNSRSEAAEVARSWGRVEQR